MKASIAEVYQSDEAVCVRIEAALKTGDTGFWMAADGFVDLSRRNWSQGEIAKRFSLAQQTVSKYIFCAKNYPHEGRPSWSVAWSKACGRDPMMTSETPEWATPQDLFDLLDNEFHFTLDVCATPENAKCAQFFTKEDDGLSLDWSGVCWMNPPYGEEIPKWMAKAYESAQAGATVVCLVPARVDTEWWWDCCRYGLIRFLRGRLKFGGAESGAPFPSAVVIFRLNPYGTIEDGVEWWEWRKDLPVGDSPTT